MRMVELKKSICDIAAVDDIFEQIGLDVQWEMS